MRLGVEFFVGVAVGSIIGYLLDKWLGTTPWLFVVFFFIGTGAGFLNVFRAANSLGRTKTGKDEEPDGDDEQP